MRYFMMLDEKKEYAEEVTKELQEEIGILHDENSMLQNKNSMLQDKYSLLHSEKQNLSERLTGGCVFIITLCQKQNMSQEETIACLEKEMQMPHEEAMEMVHGHWK